MVSWHAGYSLVLVQELHQPCMCMRPMNVHIYTDYVNCQPLILIAKPIFESPG